MSPSCTRESECLRHAVLDVLLVNYECAAVEMRIAQRTAYLQFLTDSEGALRSHNLQAADASAAATLHRNEVENVAELHLQTLCDEALQLVLRVCDVPAIEVGRLLVVVVEHFREYLLVVGVAERLRRRANPAFGVFTFSQQYWNSSVAPPQHLLKRASHISSLSISICPRVACIASATCLLVAFVMP